MTEQGTLTIEVTTGHCLGGEGNDVFPGQVLVAPRDISLAEALKKIRMGYARVIPFAPGADPVAGAGPAEVRHADPAPEDRDPMTTTPEGRKGRPRAGGR